MSHSEGRSPRGGHALIKPLLWARVGAGIHPASAGQVRGLTPRGIRRFRSHNERRVTGANPASQRQASHVEDLHAVQWLT